MNQLNKRRRIDYVVNKKRKNETSYNINDINKKIKLLNINVNYDDFKENYTEFTYDLSNGINLRKINISIFGVYLASCKSEDIYDTIRNSKYLSKYEKYIENDNIVVTEEDLWNFFEYELNEII